MLARIQRAMPQGMPHARTLSTGYAAPLAPALLSSPLTRAGLGQAVSALLTSRRRMATTTDAIFIDGRRKAARADKADGGQAEPRGPSQNGSDPARRSFEEDPLIIRASVLGVPMRRDQRLSIGFRPHAFVSEVYQQVKMSIRLGQWHRAESTIRRMCDLHPNWDPRMQDLMVEYLKARAGEIAKKPSASKFQQLHVWFEKELRQRGFDADELVLSMMCRAAIAALRESPNRDRTLRRFVEIGMEQPDRFMKFLNSGELSPEEWRILNAVIDQYAPVQESDDDLDSYKQEIEFESEESAPPASILEIDQKGIGITSLKDAVACLYDGKEVQLPKKSMTDDEKRAFLEKMQYRIEQDSLIAGAQRWREQVKARTNAGVSSQLKNAELQRMMIDWFELLNPLLQAEWSRIRKGLAREKSSPLARVHESFLLSLNPKDVALISISTLVQLFALHSLSDDGVTTTRAGNEVGRALAVYSESMMMTKRKAVWKRSREKLRAAGPTGSSLPGGGTGPGQRPHQAAKEKRGPVDENVRESLIASAAMIKSVSDEWPAHLVPLAGAHLLDFLLKVCKMPASGEGTVEVPAFSHRVVLKNGRLCGYISAHENLIRIFKTEPPAITMGLNLPMLCPPKPWRGPKNGGYLSLPTKLIRIGMFDDLQHVYSTAAARNGDLKLVFESLNAVGETGWKVSDFVLDTMIKYWNTGKEVAGFPPLDPDVPLPEPMEEGTTGVAYYRYRNLLEEAKNKISGFHSNRCYYNQQLEAAQAFRGKTFYVPQNIDFRGRAYPLSTFLNHLGSDVVRGMLKFSKKKPLGERGLRWLKIHISNLYGFDKATMDDREKFTTDHLDQIRASVADPFENRWWLDADSPWQFLGASFELVEALKLDDPATYETGIPIHQDGSCNGLQHYAALGGDTFGASQVNLLPNDQPSDIYSGIAALVKEDLGRDAADGDELAKELVPIITRKVVKQTVMTSVYGVTYVGARDQVLKQLNEVLPNHTIQGLDNLKLANNIARRIFKALSTMFGGATAIQDWFDLAAERITTSLFPEQVDALVEQYQSRDLPTYPGRGKNPEAAEEVRYHIRRQFQTPLIWTTPLRMPVVQPYKTARSFAIRSKLQSLQTMHGTTADPVSARKQRQGFPPNFIHSLDASHMMLTARACVSAGLTFASVHDSYWTHPADVDRMNEVLRDQFVLMHSDNIIARLHDEFMARYGNMLTIQYLHPASRAAGLVKEHIRKEKARITKCPSEATLRNGRFHLLLDPLAAEHRRQRLLASADPDDVRRGREMVTAGSIVESLPPEDLLPPPEEGQVPVAAATATATALEHRASPAWGGSGAIELDGEEPEQGSGAAAAAAAATATAELEFRPEAADGGLLDIEDGALPADGLDGDGEAADRRALEETELLIADAPDVPTDLFEADADADADAESDKEQAPPQAGKDGAEKKKVVAKGRVPVWIPFRLPPVPPRGKLDINVVKDSTYFFS